MTTPTILGRHTGNAPDKFACSCLSSWDSAVMVSAGWNSKVHVWDARSRPGIAVATVDLPGKAFAMDVDVARNRVVVATSGRRICVIDIRAHSAELILDLESSLK